MAERRGPSNGESEGEPGAPAPPDNEHPDVESLAFSDESPATHVANLIKKIESVLKPSTSRGAAAMSYAAALVIGLAAIAVVIIAVGGNPVRALAKAFESSIFTVPGLAQTLNRATPLTLMALGFSFARHAGLFNIGLDGQFAAGAMAAAGVGIYVVPEEASEIVAITSTIAAGAIGGALWLVIPAALRVRFGVNEILTTVMLIFVAELLAGYVATGPWNDPISGEAISYPLVTPTTFPGLLPRGGGHAGIFLASIVAFLSWWILFRTRAGYNIRAVGSNIDAARRGGINHRLVLVTALLAGGAMAGVAGAVEVTGVHQRLLLHLVPDAGVMAILISVLAGDKPIAILPVSLFFSIMLSATDSLQRSVGFPSGAVLAVQALMVLTVVLGNASRSRPEWTRHRARRAEQR